MSHMRALRTSSVCNVLRLPVCSSKEYLYREEFESYVKEGVLSMHTAFSREQARDTSPIILSRFRDA